MKVSDVKAEYFDSTTDFANTKPIDMGSFEDSESSNEFLIHPQKLGFVKEENSEWPIMEIATSPLGLYDSGVSINSVENPDNNSEFFQSHSTTLTELKPVPLPKLEEMDLKYDLYGSTSDHSLLDMDDFEQNSHYNIISIQPQNPVQIVKTSDIFDTSPTSSNEAQTDNFEKVITDSEKLCDSQQKNSSNLKYSWTETDMDVALAALKKNNMSLTRAAATYGIPATTLWQRAHRLGIDTPKKDGPSKSWTYENLNKALDAMRAGTMSANKASKHYGIPSSTLYKIAKREGIRLAAPFNANPTTWTPEDLDKALDDIRSGQSVQKTSLKFRIPMGTLYGRCKREGIELGKSNPVRPWQEGEMTEAIETVRSGKMSVNQAAQHYDLPYSSLYGRLKKGNFDETGITQEITSEIAENGSSQISHLFF